MLSILPVEGFWKNHHPTFALQEKQFHDPSFAARLSVEFIKGRSSYSSQTASYCLLCPEHAELKDLPECTILEKAKEQDYGDKNEPQDFHP